MYNVYSRFQREDAKKDSVSSRITHFAYITIRFTPVLILHRLRTIVDSILLYITEGYFKAWHTCTLYQSRLRENIRISLVSAVLSTQ